MGKKDLTNLNLWDSLWSEDGKAALLKEFLSVIGSGFRTKEKNASTGETVKKIENEYRDRLWAV